MNPEEERFDWTTRDEPLGPPPVPVSPSWPVPTQPPYPPPISGPIMPPPPPPNVTYVQPVARRGLTGPHAAIYITLIVVGALVVLPVLCCLGMAVIGAASGGGQTSP